MIIGNSYADEVIILPLKKPILGEKIYNEKVIQGVLKPKSKPTKIIEVVNNPTTNITKQLMMNAEYLY